MRAPLVKRAALVLSTVIFCMLIAFIFASGSIGNDAAGQSMAEALVAFMILIFGVYLGTYTSLVSIAVAARLT